jgi:hypothetical protein
MDIQISRSSAAPNLECIISKRVYAIDSLQIRLILIYPSTPRSP